MFKIILLIALIGHIVLGISDCLMVYGKKGRINTKNIKDSEKMAAEYEHVPLKYPSIALLTGVYAVTALAFGYLALADWMESFSHTSSVIMYASAVIFVISIVIHHEFFGLLGWFYVRLGRTPEAREAVLDFMKKTSYTMFTGYAAWLVFCVTLFIINEEQAVTVRLIFKLFLEGMTPHTIAQELTRRQIKTPTGKDVWNQSTVRRVLSNEKMKGDALLQKEFTVDFLTKKHRKNEGQVPQYYVTGNHEPIIDPAVFDMVQTEIGKRSGRGSRYSGVNIFSSKVKCGECGGWFGSKVWHSNDKYRKVIYRCNQKYSDGHKCTTPHVTEEEIKLAFIKAVNELFENRDEIIEGISLMQTILCDIDGLEEERIRLEEEISVVRELTKNVVAESGKNDAAKRYGALVERYDKATSDLETVTKKKRDQQIRVETLERFKERILSQDGLLTEFDADLWSALVDFVTVKADGMIAVNFRDGSEIEVNKG